MTVVSDELSSPEKTGVSNPSGVKHSDSGKGKIDTLQLFCPRPQITFLQEERVTEFG